MSNQGSVATALIRTLSSWSGEDRSSVRPFRWQFGWRQRAMRLRGEFVLRFFAAFCLIANGAYIGVGSFTRVGDAQAMLTLGAEALASLVVWRPHGAGRFVALAWPRTALRIGESRGRRQP